MFNLLQSKIKKNFYRETHLKDENASEEESKMKLYYVCEKCGKSFAKKSCLKTHQLHVHEIYSEDIPYDFCGKSFRTRELMKLHQAKDDNECPRFEEIEVKSQTNSKYSEKYSLEFSLEEAIKGSECFDHFTTELVNFESTSSEFHLTHSGQYIETFEPLDDATNEEQRKLEDAEKKKQAFNQGTINPMVHQVIR